MLKEHVKFHSADGKRTIMIVDDEEINRLMLGNIVGEEYNVLYAASGEEALEILKRDGEHPSLILLDLMMPGVSGIDVLKTIEKDEVLKKIPVIVSTAQEDAEVDSLKIGAVDFIKKPFEMPEVIVTRVQRAIELFEDRYTIQAVEREELTGLFNKDFFFSYAGQYDQFHGNQQMDAIALDINRFHLVNELFGRSVGDELLKHLADYIKVIRDKTECMACRVDGDKFLIYIPHGLIDYEEFSDHINEHLKEFKDIMINVRSGIYLNADRNVDVETRFDRAVHAANMIKDNYMQTIAYYDESIHAKESYRDRLLSELDSAIAGEQFVVNYQPKYNIEGEVPVFSSAEALVRWIHPELGFISPGEFIPLFEQNGMIQKVDMYIWKKVAEQMRLWREEYGLKLPVSINVSRANLYNHNLGEFLEGLLDANGLTKQDLYIEITESAYTEDSDQIIEAVNRLKDAGFIIEMDDFGTGYSSLNMLAEIPVDLLKLDMRFMQTMKSNEKQETLIRLIMDIARHLSLSVIAEGVEEEAQVLFLKEAGCKIIQGYYFSKPLPPEGIVERAKREGLC